MAHYRASKKPKHPSLAHSGYAAKLKRPLPDTPATAENENSLIAC
jgi:hypothetical protein